VTSAWSCAACSAECGTGTRTCTRTVTTQASNGGTCNDALSKTENCNTQACAAPFPPPPPPITATGYLTISAKLSLASSAWPTSESQAAFEAALKTSIAAAADLGEASVTIDASTRTARRRGLLAAGVEVDLTVKYPVDGTAAVRDLVVDDAVPFYAMAAYMADWLLPASKRDASNSGSVTTFDAPSASVGLACPPSKSFADALALSDDARYADARRALNDLAVCAMQTGTAAALDTAAMADTYNMLGYANRKINLESRDVELSELFYKRALQIDPSHLGAMGYLGELYVQTNEPALARETLDKLKVLCPPPNDCDSLTILRLAMHEHGGMAEGAFVRDVNWDASCFAEACSPMNITRGDSLNFIYGAAHDVVEVADEARYDACDLSGAVVLGGTGDGGNGGLKKTFSDVGIQYVACSRGTHCESGQKMVVYVHSERDTPVAGAGAPSYSLGPAVSGARGNPRAARGTLAIGAAAAAAALLAF